MKQEQRDNAPGGAASYLETRTFYDGLGQVIQTQSEGITNTLEASSAARSTTPTASRSRKTRLTSARAIWFVTPEFTKATTQTIYHALGLRSRRCSAPDGTTYTEHS